MKRRKFLKEAALAGASAAVLTRMPRSFSAPAQPPPAAAGKGVIVISTWDFKLPVNETAAGILQEGGSILDAVEKSINLVEADPKVMSVGRGGYPDRDGHVTLDACIMDPDGNAGSVVFLEHIVNAVSVARRVMEKTPHVVLAGEGALQFALEEGFKKENLLTAEAEKAYKKWLATSRYVPPVGRTNHDTIGLLAMDQNGNLAGGCSTSGTAWKMHGRVGDSPLVGDGLYVDNEVGGATSTGLGEAVIKIAGSFLVVEMMRAGASPQEACKMTIERMIHKEPRYKDVQDFLVGFVAMNKRGETGAFSYRKGLQYSLYREGKNQIFDADYLMK